MNTLSIIIPAYNEEKNIEAAVKAAVDAVRVNNNKISDYEILLFDDGSRDKTSEIADKLAMENNHIQVIHNRPNKGFGYNVLTGMQMAKMDYTVMTPGDDEILHESINNIFSRIGEADIIAAYHEDPKTRSLFRKFTSNLFVRIVNFLFGLKLKYYNGPNIIRTDLAKNNLPTTFGFAYSAEVMVKLLKWRKASLIHVGMKTKPIAITTAFKPKNIASVFKTIFNLFFAIYFKKPKDL